jgi:hydrogenase expression/formation protein HypE
MNKIISLAYGSGGKLTHELIKNLFVKKFENFALSQLTDSAILDMNEFLKTSQVSGSGGGLSPTRTIGKLAFTTDSYVVKPIFFPGGDIGKLSICGTVNDLSVVGAKPLFISCGMIIKEGMQYETLEKIVDSIKKTADEANVKIVTGDTKVIESATKENDEIFINTAGIGLIQYSLSIDSIEIGDKVIINGGIGEHGIAVLSARNEFKFESDIKSDCAPLNNLIGEILSVSNKIKFMRDPTRGGLATTLNEIVEGKNFSIMLKEDNIPISDSVKGICELLGFDPLYIANEGKVIVIVADSDVDKVISTMKKNPLGKDSQIIGDVVSHPAGKVFMKTLSGGTRIVDMMVSDQLPRIC